MSLNAPLVLLAVTFAFLRFLVLPYVDFIFGLLLAIAGFRLYRQQRRVTPAGPVLITGCDSGFGLLTAQSLDAMGIRVFAACLTQDGVDRLKTGSSDRVVPFLLDVTKDADVEAAAQRIAASGLGLWAVINNAGIASGLPVDLMPLPVLQKTMDINLYGGVRTTKAMLHFLKKSKGRIINLASSFSRLSLPGAMSYCCSKYAVEAFSDSLRREVTVFGISVVCLEPGYHSTGIINNITATCDSIIAQIPADKKVEYGDKYFEDWRVGAQKMAHQSWYGKPEAMRTVLLDSLFQVHPPTHRYVGSDATFFGLVSFLPGFLQDAFLAAMERVTIQLPVPASAAK